MDSDGSIRFGRRDVYDKTGRVIDPEPTMEWHPLHGCRACGDGCKNCYAVRRAQGNPALRHLVSTTDGQSSWTGELVLDPAALGDPLAELKPQTWFVAPESDLFYDRVPIQLITKMLQVMAIADWHTFYLPTRRPERLAQLCQHAPLPLNVWAGFSASNQREWDRMWPVFRPIRARERFALLEPLIGPIVLPEEALSGPEALSFVTVMADAYEAGRPMEVRWLQSLRRQCDAAGVPFFWELSSWDSEELQAHYHDEADAGRMYMAAQSARWARDLPEYALKAAGVFPESVGGARRARASRQGGYGPCTPEQMAVPLEGFSVGGWAVALEQIADTCNRAAEIAKAQIQGRKD